VWADRFGICLSALCVIHCVLTPFFLLALPSLQTFEALSAHSHENFHHVMLIIVPLLAILAFIPGFLRHRNARVFLWAIPGLILIAVGALVFESTPWVESAITIAGSFFLIRSHLINRELCACCGTGHGQSRRHLKAALKQGRLRPTAMRTDGRPLAPRRLL
jgi:hypothetical protein